ncbi:putative transcriptional regulator [Methylophilaceae bacterium 11]|jgi:putative transcriptional regulator|uniref:YqgE/AlgH family protein n=1 Tax=unclassified Methylotenera TaxID=2643294 RepID=UPI000360E857|nr:MULTISPECIES: YqgE/AlgH family protein [unclassified Methylotenera]EUJ09931.1 putative transcriptional regulator [Methylophilaceae bacterium 11]
MKPLENMNLTGQFLIAMPAMQDPFFSKTVTFICTHNEDGAMGVVLNRPMQITLDHLFNQIDIPCEYPTISDIPVFFGGPVQTERGFVLHSPSIEYNSTMQINESVALTTSKDILESTAQSAGPDKILIALGYAGWSAGQLEEEMSKNAWLSVSVSQPKAFNDLIFNLPYDEKLPMAMRLIGVDFASLSEVAGHA